MVVNTPPFINFKYTSGNEYVLQKTLKEYQGYYFEFGNEIYAGNRFELNINNKLVKSSNIGNTPLEAYEIIIGTKIPRSQTVLSFPFNPTIEDFERGSVIRYFVKKNNRIDNIIETNKSTFKEIQFNPLYQTLEVNYSFAITEEELDELDKKMSGLKVFIQDYILPTSSDENIPPI